MISYKINVFLSSESNFSEEVFLELSKKGLSTKEINDLPFILVNYISKDKNLEKLTRSYNNKNVSLVFSTQVGSSVNKQDNKISLDYFIRDNIKFKPFSKDAMLILMNLEESQESNNFLFVKGIDYLGRTKTYTKIPMDHFSEQKYETGEVFIIPNLIVYKSFIVCNPPRREMHGYLSK